MNDNYDTQDIKYLNNNKDKEREYYVRYNHSGTGRSQWKDIEWDHEWIAIDNSILHQTMNVHLM